MGAVALKFVRFPIRNHAKSLSGGETGSGGKLLQIVQESPLIKDPAFKATMTRVAQRRALSYYCWRGDRSGKCRSRYSCQMPLPLPQCNCTRRRPLVRHLFEDRRLPHLSHLAVSRYAFYGGRSPATCSADRVGNCCNGDIPRQVCLLVMRVNPARHRHRRHQPEV